MKEKILEISEKLKSDEISIEKAQKEMLNIFGVNIILRRLKNHADLYSYPSDSFKKKLKRFIKNIVENYEKNRSRKRIRKLTWLFN